MPKRIPWIALLAMTFLLAAPAFAGGSPENILLIIDPTSPESLHVGNYYKNARNIPDRNVLYLAAGAANYTAFVATNQDAFLSTLVERGIADHIDYVVIAPGTSFYVPSAGAPITDGCSGVSRFAISSPFTLAQESARVMAGGPSTATNHYYRSSDEARAFDSHQLWLNGIPSTSPSAERYFIGAQLGYTGLRGNTVAEILTMIDRSVAVDGTMPIGNFYFMQTTDPARSGPRHPFFPAAVSSIQALGGMAQHLMAVLPIGQHDCMGIMTGHAAPGIASADFTLMPGAFCDHLTSYAATFDTGSQEKMSLWIGRGASGTWGQVEEPCNYGGKFPHPRMHVFYYQGLSLGEATLRSVGFRPYQGLLYGDPMTRPFTYLPTVKVTDAPTLPMSGAFVLSPSARTLKAGATIASYDLLIDGVLHSGVRHSGLALTTKKRQIFEVDSTALSDGYHDLRVLAYDSTLVRSTGRWLGELQVNNRGRSVGLNVGPLAGDLTTSFVCDASAAGGAVTEVRIVQNGRVVAALPGGVASLPIFGKNLGAGPVEVQAEAIFADGEVVRSAPTTIDIAATSGVASGLAPEAFSARRFVRTDVSCLVELPTSYDDPADSPTYQILMPPAQATVVPGLAGPYALLRPMPGAAGSDTLTFQVVSARGVSNVGTITLIYQPDPGVTPFQALIRQGSVAAGDLRDLQASDDQYLQVQPGPQALRTAAASAIVELRGTAPVASVTELRFKIELAAPGATTQRIDLFNHATNRWVLQDQRVAPGSDAITEIVIAASPSQFIDPVTLEVRARVQLLATVGAPPAWTALFDHAQWLVTE